ncbi:MAG: hypothetical protein WA984_00375 [Phormidesmis sp.]
MKSFSKRLFWLPLALVLCGALLLGPGLGSGFGPGFGSGTKPVDAAGLSDPRLARLEFEVSALQSQVNQLQNQLSRGTNSSVQTSQPASPSERPSNLGDPTLDEQFDNLATLVIELNQRVLQVEDRLAN